MCIRDSCKVKVAKNKVAPPYKIAEFDMLFGRGISQDGCMLDAGEQVGAIERKGAWYYFNGEKLGQGREKAMAFMNENLDIKEAIEKDTRERLAAKMAGITGEKVEEETEDDDVFFGDDEEEVIAAEAR